MKTHLKVGAILTAAVMVLPSRGASPESAELQTLRDQVQALQQQLAALSHRVDAKEESATPSAKVTVSDKGFMVGAADSSSFIKFRGVAQFDSRVFFGDDGLTNNSFLLRRARIITEGTFAKNYSFLFVPEFGGSSVSILDAAVSVTLDKALTLKFGKFTPPLGLERLQGVCWSFLNEASLVSNLVPVRDVGAQASGLVANGTLSYAVGVFGGVPDAGTSSNSDFDNDKDVIARLFASPFKNDTSSPLRGLSFGVAGSVGRAKTSSGRAAAYKTDGQQTFFSYNSAVVADGRTWRVSPQADYRNGSFGAMAEYVVSTVNVRATNGAAKTELQNKSWQVSGGYVLTGEASAYTGVTPKTNLDLGAGTWGAIEVVGRVANFRVDDAAFPTLASPLASANQATSYATGVNWYLSKSVLFSTDFYLTRFGGYGDSTGIATNGVLRGNERALISRVQIAF